MSETGPALVVDTSVVIKWYTPEEGSSAATAILAQPFTLLAPDILVAELGNALWKKTRRGQLADAEARHIAQTFLRTGPVALWPSDALLSTALDVALAQGCTVYDALYLTLALIHACPFVTADAHLVQTLRGTALERTVRLLDGR